MLVKMLTKSLRCFLADDMIKVILAENREE